MSSKTFTECSGSAYYTEDSSNVNSGGGGGTPVTWLWNGVGLSEIAAITDSEDTSWWAYVRPNAGDPDVAAWGSMRLQEDSILMPWNSTITSVEVKFRASRSNGSTGIIFRPYVRQTGVVSKPTSYGSNISITSTSVVETGDTFSTDWASATWTVDTLLNESMIGVLGKFNAGPGNHEGRLIKLFAVVNFTLPTPTLSSGSAVPAGASAAVQVTANANHTFGGRSSGTDGYPVTVVVEWGLTAAYGNSKTLSSSVTDSSNSVCSGTISGLASGTTYHYRFKATDGDNTVVTSDGTFTTTMGDPILLSF